jgi:hypothetical protein
MSNVQCPVASLTLDFGPLTLDSGVTGELSAQSFRV